jgi:hypothetical protein
MMGLQSYTKATLTNLHQDVTAKNTGGRKDRPPSERRASTVPSPGTVAVRNDDILFCLAPQPCSV